MQGQRRAPDVLAHDSKDTVAVAVRDLDPGEVVGGYLRGDDEIRVQLAEAVPLGHKVALVDMAVGEDVIEYGLRVGITTQPIAAGAYVHTHNVRSARWQNSVA